MLALEVFVGIPSGMRPENDMTNCRHDPQYGYKLETRWWTFDMDLVLRILAIVRANCEAHIKNRYLLVETVVGV